MISPIIAFAIAASFLTLAIRVVISRRPFHVKNTWTQIIVSTFIGMILWIIAILSTRSRFASSRVVWGDIICGILIFLSALWCNYWSGNLAGGFRVQMQFNIACQNAPISLDEWMRIFGGLGMEVFLKDRIESILIPWNTIVLENGYLRLRSGWGMFFGRLAEILKKIMPKVRSDN
ncbi:MAG TPA: hypothetical protein VHP14_17110 [Anaerolineales bacterium]|nr:hypothetical protein [Anaerolineales bacterium]